MSKVGELNVGNVMLCDDIRQEQGNNKFILIGVYSGDIIISELPADISLAFYMEIKAPKGHHQIEIRLSGPQKGGQAILKSQFEHSGVGTGTIASPRINISMAEEGPFRIDMRAGTGRWVNLISKRVMLNPNALQAPPAQVVPAPQ